MGAAIVITIVLLWLLNPRVKFNPTITIGRTVTITRTRTRRMRAPRKASPRRTP